MLQDPFVLHQPTIQSAHTLLMLQDLMPHTHTHTHTVAAALTYSSPSQPAVLQKHIQHKNRRLVGAPSAPSARSLHTVLKHTHHPPPPHTLVLLHSTFMRCVLSRHRCVCERTGKATQAVTVVERGREETEGGREGGIHLPFWFWSRGTLLSAAVTRNSARV